METVIGVTLALGVALFASAAGFDRARSFYPVLLVMIAGYYVLFAVQAGSVHILTLELWFVCGFVSIAVAGFRWNLWLVVAGLLGHGMLDFVHPHLMPNPSAPIWWPQFCLAFDAAAAVCLAVRLLPSMAPAVAAELAAAELCERHGRWAAAFAHLERAHVLGQTSTIDHVRVHVRMLWWGLRRRDTREVRGQLVRIIGAATKTALGLVPRGNTGGSKVSAFRPMPISAELAVVLAAMPRASLRERVAEVWRAGGSEQTCIDP
ncbi:DUF3703 domain-containing protein [Phenylobacterium sp.]|uniref:DUF3703 domain-containing protein n=1 Tax=Phenylobacterium sp. TaxID=1871053 RepID=UPI00286E3934|nr:DUF3703 domain-containing protein [Phenylobacterium sp.]